MKRLLIISIIGLCGCTGNSLRSNSSANELDTQIETAKIEEPKVEKPRIYYETIWESNTKRYDHAPSFIVVTDTNSHKRMHELVDEFARKLSSKKFTLDVFDDKTAGVLYKASHYGANDVGRIATQAELKLFDEHSVGSYIGELEANGNPYEIMYHGFGLQKVSFEDYEPKTN